MLSSLPLLTRETGAQRDEGPCPQFHGSKAATHTGSSSLGFRFACGQWPLPTRLRDPCYIPPEILCHALNLGPHPPTHPLPCHRPYLGCFCIPGPVLGVGGCGHRRGENRRRAWCLSQGPCCYSREDVSTGVGPGSMGWRETPAWCHKAWLPAPASRCQVSLDLLLEQVEPSLWQASLMFLLCSSRSCFATIAR